MQVNEGQKLQEVGRLMIKHNFSSIPVVDLCGRPIDVITKFDIAAALSAVADVKVSVSTL